MILKINLNIFSFLNLQTQIYTKVILRIQNSFEPLMSEDILENSDKHILCTIIYKRENFYYFNFLNIFQCKINFSKLIFRYLKKKYTRRKNCNYGVLKLHFNSFSSRFITMFLTIK